MKQTQKVAIGKDEIVPVIEARLKRSNRYADLKYKVVSIPEHTTDENFKIEIVNPEELPWFTIQEARFIIFAPVLRQFRLK